MIRDKRFLVVDTETTGLRWEKNGVIEVAFVLGQYGKIESEFQAVWKPLHWMQIDPWVEANGKAYKHTLGWEEDGFLESMLLLSGWLEKNYDSETVWSAYNSPFDINMLKALELKEGIRLSKYTNWEWLDILVWQRHHNVKGNTLSQACTRKGIKIGDAHRALDDARASFHLLFSLLSDIFPNEPTGIGELSFGELIAHQKILATSDELNRLVGS